MNDLHFLKENKQTLVTFSKSSDFSGIYIVTFRSNSTALTIPVGRFFSVLYFIMTTINYANYDINVCCYMPLTHARFGNSNFSDFLYEYGFDTASALTDVTGIAWVLHFVIRSNDHGKVSICVSNACVPSSCKLNWYGNDSVCGL